MKRVAEVFIVSIIAVFAVNSYVFAATSDDTSGIASVKYVNDRIPTVNNGTLTIKQGDITKTFSANQAGNVTVTLTDDNTTYTAAGTNGVSASVSSSGNISVSGTSATRDVVGVAKLGVIPVGTTGTGTATIWVE